MERPVLDFRDCVPHGDFDRADRDRTLAMTARFFSLHHRAEDSFGIEIVACRTQQRIRIGTKDTRNESRSHLRAAGITSGRIEGISDDRSAAALGVGDDRHDRSRHL